MDTAIVHVDRSEEQPRIIIEPRNVVPTWVICALLALGIILAIIAVTEMHKLSDKVRLINMLQSDREAGMSEFFKTHYSTSDGEWHLIKELAKR